MSDLRPRRSHGYITGIVALLSCVLVALLLLVNRQYILDQLSVWQYKPSPVIMSFAARSGMNETGEFYFYASRPLLADAQAFNQKCDRQEEKTAILGCYDGQYIYIYNVVSPELDGIREVTAAHEMLHAAYARLAPSRKKEVDTLLEAEYTKLRSDQKFAERMAFYERTEPGERSNELHSVIGTEVADISPELDTYYKAYFSDRERVVTLHGTYASVFASLEKQAGRLVTQLTQLKNKIEAESADYNKDISEFNQDVRQFERQADANEFSSQAEIDTQRSGLLGRASLLDARRDLIKSEVAEYERLRNELMKISSQSEALNRSIDSSLAPPPSL
jgi:hypothetical protein